jgi:hypothetical protein
MKAHIFIATTQGLVAIQHIAPIDDEDISSVVSINGTSTTANISSSYHNFVKKGVGIIQQMFGACSYRVDISARIDQGNSWQVAMYLAHVAQSKGMLGDGQVQKGDTVICATGEVNTTNLQILAVSEVEVKLKLAKTQLDQWTAMGATATFLIPQANQQNVTDNPYVDFVSHLDQAAMALPNLKNNQPSSSRTSSKPVRTPIKIAALVLGLIVLFTLVFMLFKNSSEVSESAHESIAKDANFSDSIQLTALIKQGGSCEQTSRQNITLIQAVFADVTLTSLCELSLHTDLTVTQVLLVAKDAYTIFPLNQNQQNWQIPLPKNRLSDRAYYLVTLTQSINQEKIEALRLYRETMPKADLLTIELLNDWLAQQEVEFAIYTHRLLMQ